MMRNPRQRSDRTFNLGEYQPYENELLVQAEVALEAERERISDLKSRLQESEAHRRIEQTRIVEETEQLRNNNAILRSDRDLMQIELGARYLAGDEERHEEIERLEQHVKHLEQSAQDLRKQVSSLQQALGSLPTINERLQAENVELRERLTALNALAPGVDGDLAAEFQVQGRLKRLKAEVNTQERMLRALRVKQEEAQQSATTLASSELELMEARSKIKEQQQHIQRLMDAVDLLNKEKTLLPPTLLMLNKKMRCTCGGIKGEGHGFDDSLDLLIHNRLKEFASKMEDTLGSNLRVQLMGFEAVQNVSNGLVSTVGELKERQDLERSMQTQQLGQITEMLASLRLQYEKLLLRPSPPAIKPPSVPKSPKKISPESSPSSESSEPKVLAPSPKEVPKREASDLISRPPIKAVTTKEPFDNFQIVNREIRLYQREGDPPVLILRAEDTQGKFDDLTRAFTLTRRDENGIVRDQFRFKFDDLATYNAKKAALDANGFFDKREDARLTDEVAVVRANEIILYRNYNSPKPEIIRRLDRSRATAEPNRERMEYKITEMREDGKPRTWHLDCATTSEYTNWLRALEFAGFVKPDRQDLSNEAYKYMDKYVFQIRVELESVQPDLDWISILPEAVTLFRSSKGDRRILYVARSHNCEISTVLKTRVIRIRRNMGTPDEDRIELLCPTITAFDLLHSKLQSEGFLATRNNPATGRAEAAGDGDGVFGEGVRLTRFLRAKPRGISFWKNPKQSLARETPNVVVPGSVCYGEIDMNENKIFFRTRPKAQLSTDLQNRVQRFGQVSGYSKVENSAEVLKWELAMFVGALESQPRPTDLSQRTNEPPISVYIFHPKHSLHGETVLRALVHGSRGSLTRDSALRSFLMTELNTEVQPPASKGVQSRPRASSVPKKAVRRPSPEPIPPSPEQLETTPVLPAMRSSSPPLVPLLPAIKETGGPTRVSVDDSMDEKAVPKWQNLSPVQPKAPGKKYGPPPKKKFS